MAVIIYPQGTVKVVVPSGDKIAVFSHAPCKVYQEVGYPNQPKSLDLITETTAGSQFVSDAFSDETVVQIDCGAAEAFYEIGADPSVAEPQTDITAADDTFTITGLAAAQGGFVESIGGVSSTAGNAGGAAKLTGGVPGVTGVGGSVDLLAADGGATSGSGGAVNITSGAGTNGDADGGNIVVTPGIKDGTGLDGAIVSRGLEVGKQGAPTAKTTAVTLTIAELITKILAGTHTVGSTAAYTLPTGTLMDAGLPSLAVNDSFDWILINLSAAAADTITVTAGTGHTIVGNPIVQSAHSTTGGLTGNSAQFRTRKTAANTYVTYRIA